MLPLIRRYLTRRSSRLLRIALVGGPKGGKSTLLKHLELRYGARLTVLDETATGLFVSGLAAPPRRPEDLDPWLIDFQQVVLTLQAYREMYLERYAAQDEVEVILHDRGSADIVAYLPGGEVAMVDLLPEVTLDALYAQYDVVVHLESLATANPPLFDTKGNATRYETLEQAQAREFGARRAWEKHPNYHFISGEGGIESVIFRALNVIRPYFDKEIERRWKLPAVPDVPLGPGIPMQVGYLTTSGNEVRIRREGERCVLSGKSGTALKRWEEPVDISLALFESMWPLTDNRRLHKTRYILNLPGGPYELDVHEGPHEGLITVEKSFRSVEDAEAFELPPLFHAIRDVTLEPAYRSWQLAMAGSVPAA